MIQEPSLTAAPNVWTLLVALVPTFAVVVNYLLQRRSIREAKEAGLAATAETVKGNKAHAGELAEVKRVVNGQSEKLRQDLDHERRVNQELAAQLARLKGRRSDDPQG